MNPDDYQFHRPPNTAANRFRGQHIISDQVGQGELGVVWRELERVIAARVPGDIVEFGCYVGTTSLFLRRQLDETGEPDARALHVYDSFEGLPPKTAPDNSGAGAAFQAGKLAVSKKEFIQQFKAANLRLPVIHKGWFNQLTENDVPAHIAFAFLDGDFYGSVMDSLKLVWPRMTPGGAILVDDYGREALPGAERAVRDFLQNKPAHILRAEHNVAIIRV